MTRDMTDLHRLAATQAGLVNRAQLAELGINRELVARRVERGLWRPLGPRVVGLHIGRVSLEPLSREQQWWAGFLHASLDFHGAKALQPRCALTGLTAAEAGGLSGFESDHVHVVVDHGREVGSLTLPGLHVRVHQTRHLLRGETQNVALPPRIRLPRAVMESASGAAIRQPNRARAIVVAAVQQRLVRPADLRDFVLGRRTLPGRRLLLECCDDAEGGSHSLPELDYRRGLRRAGLPLPRQQRVMQHANGRWYLDNDFADHLVTVEINGIQHYQQMLSEHDDWRRAMLQIGGRIVVDLSAYAVRRQIEKCMLLTAEALMAHGYRPPPATQRCLAEYRALLGWRPDQLRLRAS